jgi:hypothetical protein
MKQITLEISEKKYPFFLELVKSLDWVKKVEVIDNDEPTKEEILKGLREAVEEVKKIKSGKAKAKSLSEFLNEL